MVLGVGKAAGTYRCACTCGTERELTRSQFYAAHYAGRHTCPECERNAYLRENAIPHVQGAVIEDVDPREPFTDLGDGWFRGNTIDHDPVSKLAQQFINTGFLFPVIKQLSEI